MDTSIQVGPTGKKPLPLTVKNGASAPGGHARTEAFASSPSGAGSLLRVRA
ncbi:hypothetical protein ACFV23_53100 [Streptomyces sp. NPDC059627]